MRDQCLLNQLFNWPEIATDFRSFDSVDMYMFQKLNEMGYNVIHYQVVLCLFSSVLWIFCFVSQLVFKYVLYEKRRLIAEIPRQISTPGSVPGNCILDLRWTKWHWIRFFFEYFHFPLFHHTPVVHTHRLSSSGNGARGVFQAVVSSASLYFYHYYYAIRY